jgi:hypothetical protein
LLNALVLTLSDRHIADCIAQTELLEQIPAGAILQADKGYDAYAIRRQIENRSAMLNSSPRRIGNEKIAFRQYLTETRASSNRYYAD